MQVTYTVDPQTLVPFVPAPLVLADPPGIVEVSFCDSSAVSAERPAEAWEAPSAVNFRECLAKIRCRLGELEGWFVPFSWVDSDVSLVRGLVQGFPKKLGTVHMTRFQPPSPRVGGRREGALIGGTLSTPSGLAVHAVHTCARQLDASEMRSYPFLLLRYFPGTASSTPAVLEVAKPEIVDACNVDIWEGPATIRAWGSGTEHEPIFRPLSEPVSRSFRSSFTIAGSRVLCTL